MKYVSTNTSEVYCDGGFEIKTNDNMKNFKKLNIRWNRDNEPDYESLGIDPPENNYYYKPVYVNIDAIVLIEEYQGMCCIWMSGATEESLTTDIPYKDDIEYLKSKIYDTKEEK